MIQLLIKLAFKELRYNLRFTLFFVFNLALGLSGLAAIDSLKISISDALALRAKGILAADFSVGARRPLNEIESKTLQNLLPKELESSKVFESFTMVSTPTNSRLVELKAIETNYPFYGEIVLENSGVVQSHTDKDLFVGANVWVYPELLTQLGLKLGDELQIGQLKLKITDLILQDSAGVGAGFTFAPPIYISLNNFSQTGLLRVGSTGYFATLYKFQSAAATTENLETQIEQLKAEINRALPDPAIRVQTSKDASEQVGRMLAYLSDYLGLAGLVALFLTALGQIFLYRSYIVKRRQDIAIFKSIGLDESKIFLIYIIHILLLGFLALIPTYFITSFLLPALSHPIGQLINIQFQLQFQWLTLLLVLCVSLVGGLLICAPLLLNALQVRPLELLTPAEVNAEFSFKKGLYYFAPSLVAYYLISLWFAKSYVTGSAFFFLFLAALIVFVVFGVLLLNILKADTRHLTLRLAMRNLTRARLSTLAALTTLGLGVTLANLIPILENGIRTEIEAPAEIDQPSLFLFDIQPEQKEGLDQLLSELDVKVMQSSPMIRSRLTHVNGQEFEKRTVTGNELTREEENENRFRNRGFNLTYRSELSRSEKIIDGLTFEKWRAQNKTPKAHAVDDQMTADNEILPISIEVRFASRLNLKIDDVLTFDVQGVPIEGRIVNLRKVRWTSFQPNFFIQFEDNPELNPLRDAPQTHLTTLGQISNEKKLEVQTRVVQKYPNVSIVDVSRIVDRLTGIIRQMSIALKVMSLFSILVGLVILFSILSHQVYERRRDINLLKILGARFRWVQTLFIYEFILICFVAIIIGTGISLIIGRVLAVQFFDSAYSLSFVEPTTIGLTLLFVCFLIIISVTHKVLKSRPLLEAKK